MLVLHTPVRLDTDFRDPMYSLESVAGAESVSRWFRFQIQYADFPQTVSSLSSFFLAMVLHPAVQVKAQAELDSVIGSGRLPDYNDRPSMPYINAIVKEVLRWNPVAPLGDYSPLMAMINGVDAFFFRSSPYGHQRRHL